MAVILKSDGVTVVEATDVFTANDPWGRSASRTASALARALDAIGLISDWIDTHRLMPGRAPVAAYSGSDGTCQTEADECIPSIQ